MGIGFLNSLKEAYPTLKDDIEAIKFAVKEGVSSKRLIEKRVRGVGLSNISGFLRNRGEIEIISYTGYWRQRHDGSIHTKRLLCPLPGSCVNLIIDKQNVLDISSITDSIWGD